MLDVILSLELHGHDSLGLNVKPADYTLLRIRRL